LIPVYSIAVVSAKLCNYLTTAAKPQLHLLMKRLSPPKAREARNEARRLPRLGEVEAKESEIGEAAIRKGLEKMPRKTVACTKVNAG